MCRSVANKFLQDSNVITTFTSLGQTIYFSSEIVEPAYGNKNCSGFFYPRLAQEGLGVTFTRNY